MPGARIITNPDMPTMAPKVKYFWLKFLKHQKVQREVNKYFPKFKVVMNKPPPHLKSRSYVNYPQMGSCEVYFRNKVTNAHILWINIQRKSFRNYG